MFSKTSPNSQINTRSSHPEMFCKFHRILFNKVTVPEFHNFIWKDTGTGVFLRNLQIFKNNYFQEHLWMTDSKLYLKETPTQVFSCEFCELFNNTHFREHLQTAGSKTPVRGFLFNKDASLTTWKPLAVSEKDSSACLFLWILYNF